MPDYYYECEFCNWEVLVPLKKFADPSLKEIKGECQYCGATYKAERWQPDVGNKVTWLKKN